MTSFVDKKILLFAPEFFGYDKEIKKKLEAFGAEVDLYNERPSSNFFIKATIRVYKKLISYYTENYFNTIIKLNKGNDTITFLL
jgi:hypothetical protein